MIVTKVKITACGTRIPCIKLSMYRISTTKARVRALKQVVSVESAYDSRCRRIRTRATSLLANAHPVGDLVSIDHVCRPSNEYGKTVFHVEASCAVIY